MGREVRIKLDRALQPQIRKSSHERGSDLSKEACPGKAEGLRALLVSISLNAPRSSLSVVVGLSGEKQRAARAVGDMACKVKHLPCLNSEALSYTRAGPSEICLEGKSLGTLSPCKLGLPCGCF